MLRSLTLKTDYLSIKIDFSQKGGVFYDQNFIILRSGILKRLHCQ